MATETYWTIPAIGGKFHSEKDAFKFLGQLWGRISGLLFNDWQRYEVEHELEGYGKQNWFNSFKCDDLKWNDSSSSGTVSLASSRALLAKTDVASVAKTLPCFPTENSVGCSHLDVYAKRLFKLFDEYMADNEWDEEIIVDYLSYGLKDGKVEYFKRDHLPTEDKVASSTPEEFWNELAHKNDGNFFVWPLDCYGEGKTLPAYWGMVPQVIYAETPSN